MLLLNPYRFAAAGGYDTDAQAYISAVEAADGQSLETAVRDAFNAFVVGCKTDGNWNAIKACCAPGGARTLAGALVPLVGTAPTNNGFVSGDYNRKTGLAGNGSSKYLNSNRADNADPQNNAHRAVWITTADTRFNQPVGQAALGSANAGPTSRSTMGPYNNGLYSALRSPANLSGAAANATGFLGVSRSSSAQYTFRRLGSDQAITSTSVTPGSQNIAIFADQTPTAVDSWTNARLAFYSLGESLNLSLLDSRVSALLSALAAAIP